MPGLAAADAAAAAEKARALATAAELGEAPFGGTHFKALFALGIILFIMTFVFNTLVETVKTKKI